MCVSGATGEVDPDQIILSHPLASNQVCGVRGRFYEGIGWNWILWSDDMMAGEDQSAVIAALLQEAVARPRRSGAERP